MGGTFITLLIIFLVYLFFKLGPQEAAQEQQAPAPEPEAPAPTPPSGSGSSGGDDPFKAPGS